MISLLEIFLYIFIFIGLSFFCEWIHRKVVARVQRRYGPQKTGPFGILQPFADFIKLLSKDDLTRGNLVFDYSPIALVALSLFSLFLVPFHSSFLGFKGDFLVIIALLNLYVIFIFLIGIYSGNRFSLIGSMREATFFFSYESVFIISVLSFLVFSNTLTLSGLSGFSPILIVPGSIYLVASISKLNKPPFDAATAAQEIVGGYETDLSGRKLALLHLAENLEFLFVGVLGAALLFGPSSWNIVQAIPLIMVISFVSALFPRLRTDQASKWFLKYPLPLSILGVFLCSL